MFVLTAFTLTALDYRSTGGSSAFDAVRRGSDTVFGPAQRAIGSAVSGIGDAVERVLRDDDRHAGFVPEPLVEAVQERTAAGEHDAAVHDVARQLGRALVEGVLDRVDDLVDRLLDRLADLLGADGDRLWAGR